MNHLCGNTQWSQNLLEVEFGCRGFFALNFRTDFSNPLLVFECLKKYTFSVYFLLFPCPKFFFLFFGISLSNLEKIGIDEKVICYHNISN